MVRVEEDGPVRKHDCRMHYARPAHRPLVVGVAHAMSHWWRLRSAPCSYAPIRMHHWPMCTLVTSRDRGDAHCRMRPITSPVVYCARSTMVLAGCMVQVVWACGASQADGSPIFASLGRAALPFSDGGGRPACVTVPSHTISACRGASGVATRLLVWRHARDNRRWPQRALVLWCSRGWWGVGSIRRRVAGWARRFRNRPGWFPDRRQAGSTCRCHRSASTPTRRPTSRGRPRRDPGR